MDITTVHVQTDEEWKNYKAECWNLMDPELREEAVEVLNKVFDDESAREIKKLIDEKGIHWITPYHFRWGMQVRNTLRQSGLTDDKLPDHNWDDYYVQVIEETIRRRFS